MGGTISLLCAALRSRIAEVVADMRLEEGGNRPPGARPNPGQRVFRAPSVINGFLPPKKAEIGDHPFIIVRPTTGRIEGETEHTKQGVVILIGTYADDAEGHEDLLTIVQKVIQSVRESPTLDNRYTLAYPLNWEVYEQQQQPFWTAAIDTEWTVPTPVRVGDFADE